MGQQSIPRSLRRTKDHWERLARTDPLWAILADPDKKNGGWDKDAFFQSGVGTVDDEISRLRTRCSDVGSARALDFGCGVGRLTQGLSRHFERVIGVDISAGMIAMAKDFNRHPEKVEYVHNPGADLRSFGDDHFDLVFSMITLQHMNRRHACRYMAEFVRVTKPGGYVLFQIPSRRLPERTFRLRWRRRILRSIEWVNRRLLIDRRPHFEMHMVSESIVRQVLTEAGATVIDATPNSGSGERYLSMGYLARKGRRN